MMMPTVWFNRHLSNTWELIVLLREARGVEEFRMLCSHPRPNYPGRDVADLFEVEPEKSADDAFVEYCLDIARRHEVSLFLPGRKLLPILRARQRFESQGVRLLAAADPDTLKVLNNKALVYASLKDAGLLTPEHEVVNDWPGFEAAWLRLRSRHSVVCYKPTVSLYGQGFHIVTEDAAPAQPGVKIGLDDARRILSEKPRFADLLVMPYLPGPERSVDCLARDGDLIRCIVRRKEEGGQVLEDNPEIVARVRRLTKHFGLTHLFNVQFRDSEGVSHLLEINPRMSGGLPFACRSGLVLPYWAIRLAQGSVSISDIPEPRTGIWVPQPEAVSSV